MNNYLSLGREIISGYPTLWDKHHNNGSISDIELEKIGRTVYSNKKMLNHYLYCKYELLENCLLDLCY